MKKREKNLNTEDSQMLQELAESDMEQVIGGSLIFMLTQSNAPISKEVLEVTCIYLSEGGRVTCDKCLRVLTKENVKVHTESHGLIYSLLLDSYYNISDWPNDMQNRPTSPPLIN
jgi:hypothetical protein